MVDDPDDRSLPSSDSDTDEWEDDINNPQTRHGVNTGNIIGDIVVSAFRELAGELDVHNNSNSNSNSNNNSNSNSNSNNSNSNGDNNGDNNFNNDFDIARETLQNMTEAIRQRTEGDQNEIEDEFGTSLLRFTTRVGADILGRTRDAIAQSQENVANPSQSSPQEQARQGAAVASGIFRDIASGFREELAPHILGERIIQAGRASKNNTPQNHSRLVHTDGFNYDESSKDNQNSNQFHQTFQYLFAVDGSRQQLPTDVKLAILANYIDLKELGRLDAAITNRKLRLPFLKLLEGLRSKACNKHHYESMELLRWVGKKGIDIRNFSTSFTSIPSGDTPLIWACRNNDYYLAKTLVHSSQINIASKSSVSCFEGPGSMSMSKVDADEPLGGRPIHYAVYSNNFRMVQILVENADLDLKVTDLNGRNSLHYACSHLIGFSAKAGNSAFGTTATAKNPDIPVNVQIASLLLGHLESSPSVDTEILRSFCNNVDAFAMTPILTACAAGDAPMVRFLLSYSPIMTPTVDQSQLYDDTVHFVRRGDANEYSKTCLHYAASSKNVDVLTALLTENTTEESLLELKSLASVKDEKDMQTCLHVAAENGDIDIIEMLSLSLQPDLLDTNRKGQCALHIAAEKGNAGAIKLLIQLSCKNVTESISLKSLCTATDKDGNTFLHSAAMCGHTNCLQAILSLQVPFDDDVIDLKKIINIDAQNSIGFTPLHYACSKGYIDTVKLLINLGNANVNMQGKQGSTPLIISSFKKHFTLAKVLLEANAEVEYISNMGSALFLAVEQNQFHLVDLLLNQGRALVDNQNNSNSNSNSNRKSALHTAVAKGLTPIVALLVGYRNTSLFKIDNTFSVPVNLEIMSNRLKQTALLLVCDSSPELDPVSKHLLNTGVEYTPVEAIVFLLLESGCDKNSVDSLGNTALHYCIENRHRTAMYMILAHNRDKVEGHQANPNIANSNGNTPLIEAVKKTDEESVTLLLQYGADPTILDFSMQSPLYHACAIGMKDTVDRMLYTGLNVLINEEEDLVATAFERSVYATLNTQNELGHTPLHVAVLNVHQNIVKQLLLLKAFISDDMFDIEKLDNDGLTPKQCTDLRSITDLFDSTPSKQKVVEKFTAFSRIQSNEIQSLKGMAEQTKLILDKDIELAQRRAPKDTTSTESQRKDSKYIPSPKPKIKKPQQNENCVIS